jgi:hypothetical protein
VWVDNSGHGEVGFADRGRFVAAARLPGWTRGLCFARDVAFVGTSRVIPKYARYAPGVDASTAVCGVHAVDTRSGKTLASVEWPFGNQIFAIDWIESTVTGGFLSVPFRAAGEHEKTVFYAYLPQPVHEEPGR